MERYGFILPTLLIALIPKIGHSQIEPNEALSMGRPVFTPSTSVDTSTWLTQPGLAFVLAEPNELSVTDEALFATYSFSHAGITYNIEFYYRELYQRLRARVLIGDRELKGLFNRFYGVEPTRRYMLSVYGRDEGNPALTFNFGNFSTTESAINMDAIYDTVEKFAAKPFTQKHTPWIRVYHPPGMLEKTCEASVNGPCLVNEEGQIGPFTLENLMIAYRQEGIKAKEHEDIEKIGLSLVKTHGESKGLINAVISDVNELRQHGSKLLDSVNAAEIKPPTSYRDPNSNMDYWTCYAFARYKMGPAILTRYTFGFQNGFLRSGERTVMGEDATGAYTGYTNLGNVREQEKIVLDQNSQFQDDNQADKRLRLRTFEPEKSTDSSTLLSFATLRFVFVGAGVILLVLAYAVRKYVRGSSRVPGPGGIS